MTDLVPAPATRLIPADPNTDIRERRARLLDPWLGNYSSTRTKEAYGYDVERWFEYCAQEGIDVLSPRPGNVTAWRVSRIEDQGDSESSANRRISSVLSFYNWARHEGLTEANPKPFRRPQPKQDDVDILGLTREQFREVYRKAGSPRNTAFVALLGRCGLRVSEALDADVSAIREQSGHRVIRVVGKGAKPRTVPIPPSAWRPLSEYLGDRDGAIFVTRTGNRWTRRDAWATVRAIGDRAGVPDLHPHVLRHTAATLMLESGAPLDRVQLVMGHASPETTMRYARARDRLDGSAVYDLERYLAAED